MLRVLEAGNVLTASVETGEQLIEKGLGLGALRSSVVPPPLYEFDETLANLLAGDRHSFSSESELLVAVWHREIGPLHEVAVSLCQCRLGALHSVNQMLVSILRLQLGARSASSITCVRNEKQNLLDLATARLIHRNRG